MSVSSIIPTIPMQKTTALKECGDLFCTIPGVAIATSDLSRSKSLKVVATPVVPHYFLARRPQRQFQFVTAVLVILSSLIQVSSLPIDPSRASLWSEESSEFSPAQPTELNPTGNLPIPLDLYHPIEQHIDPCQPIMTTNLYDAPISTAPPLDIFPRKYHPVTRNKFLNVPASTPLPTNKFYSNLFLEGQGQGFWTAPYMGWWNRSQQYGMSISHIDPNQRALGPATIPGHVQYYINPLGINSFTFGANELNATTSVLLLTEPTDTSVQAGIYADIARYGNQTKRMTLPLVQGMGFVTAEYTDLQPRIYSGVFFRSVTKLADATGGLQRWRVQLEDGKFWALFVRTSDGGAPLNLTLQGNNVLAGSRVFTGMIQISKYTSPEMENVIVATAGAYPIAMNFTASISGSAGTYSFTYEKRGASADGNLFMYAFKHHLSSLAPGTPRTGFQLSSATKGMMEAIKANSWTMIEPDLPVNITFAINDGRGLTAYATRRIQEQVRLDLDRDFRAITDGDSWYFSGKALANIAQNCLTANIVGLPDVARAALVRLKDAFAKFAENRTNFYLVYDTNWGGLISNALFATGDPGQDFGNSHYNDHHFHYGYHIYTAAIIAQLDKVLNNSVDWLQRNEPWVNNLIRDVHNPHKNDPYFSRMRSFDVFHGHSWAKGLFESADGKDQESSSEDVLFAFGMKLWGIVTNNKPMEGRGNLLAGILKRSFGEYVYVTAGNTTHPPEFGLNKGGGIYFENKADHTTYFGNLIQYIHGIHMLPFIPFTPYIRTAQYCAEEWATWFEGRTGNITDGWKSVLYGNVACWQPVSSWLFFDQANYDPGWTTDGTSRSWFMLNAALLGGAPQGIENYRYGKSQTISKSEPSGHIKH